ncbi:MAG: hypothetical protein HZA77_15495 [Candidatus Schekmanbacteria bacterium]|nr:hypothetical protein [Candidatus Schekmanbacteria bacterium]
MSNAGRAFADTYTIDIKAYIDGEDQLIIHDGTLQWHHLQAAAVGRHLGANKPTIISTSLNCETQMDSVKWTPTWPEEPPAEIRYEAYSSVFSELTPLLPDSNSYVTLTDISSRGTTVISQEPSISNDYTLIIDFDDIAESGSALYHVMIQMESPPPDYIINIKAYIDGRDQLIIQDGTLQWHHLKFAA